ncbi:MAG TPA: DUF1801 domain-containing protein [Parafilimonas sp.]|nr:DUF1801 domain-containing protein [Parafilimonas sp.]
MKITPGTKFKDTDEYISVFPEATQKILQQLRNTIKKAAPKAVEVISYNMPAFKQNTVLVYFAGYDKHIGFYPTPSALDAFKEEIAVYKNSKGAVQFPLNERLPLALITKMVKFRVARAQEKS